MSKKKDEKWYRRKIDDMKKEKRETLGSLKGKPFIKGDYVKKIKETYKRTKRSYKRAEKQNWKNNLNTDD
jgi:hypothetical protein